MQEFVCEFLHFPCLCAENCISLQTKTDKYPMTKAKTNRLEALKMIISSQELGSQNELLNALSREVLLSHAGYSQPRFEATEAWLRLRR